MDVTAPAERPAIPSSPGLSADVIRRGIAPALERAWGAEHVDIAKATEISAGASRLSWTLDVRTGTTTHRLVLQRERVRGRGVALTVQAQLLQAAKTAGVPVPEVVLVDPDGDALGGAFIVTTMIEGHTLPRRILEASELRHARRTFGAQCGRTLAAIHSIPASTVPALARRDPLTEIERMLDATQDPRPVFELGLRWLRRHRPVGREAVVVHGDFRNGNLIVGPDGIRAVLDWELAHLGDPLEDLAWVCARPWRFGGRAVVGGISRRADLLDAYSAAGGATVTTAEMHWWQLWSTVRWGAMCLEQARTHLSSEFRSVELAVLGRRACEMEYAVLRALS